MECFETIMILDDRMTEKDYEALVNHYVWTLTEEMSAHLKGVDKMGKKKLAYPIKIKDSDYECHEGWYILFTYKMHPDFIAKLENKMREDGAVVKFLTVKRTIDDDLEDYAYVPDDRIDEMAQSPAEILAGLKSEQVSNVAKDSWDLIFGGV